MIYDLRIKNNKAFTLVELLVAAAIGMILIGFGSVALNDFNQSQKLEATRQELLATLRLARNYAITNQLSSGANIIGITFEEEGRTYINDNRGKNFFDRDISPNGIKIKSTPSTIHFSVSDGRSITTSLVPLVGTTAVVVVTGDDDSTKTINIDESGLIYEK